MRRARASFVFAHGLGRRLRAALVSAAACACALWGGAEGFAQGAEDRVFVEQSWQALFQRRFDAAQSQSDRAALVAEFKSFLKKKGRALSASPQLSRQLGRQLKRAAQAPASPRASKGREVKSGGADQGRARRGKGPQARGSAAALKGEGSALAGVTTITPMDTAEFEGAAPQWLQEGLREVALKSGVSWVPVPGGVQTIGVGVAPSLEGPSRAVRMEPFWVMPAEVTVAQYTRCVSQRACTVEGVSAFEGCNWGKAGREDHPMNCVTWHQARRFARWVGGDLPSEAAWEFAARALKVSELLDDVLAGAWTEESANETRRSASKEPSEGGAYDMLGNVWEWTLDEFSLTLEGAPQSGAPRCVEERCAVVNDLPRTMRGGAWYDTAVNLRVTSRAGSLPDHRDDGVGFRVVRAR